MKALFIAAGLFLLINTGFTSLPIGIEATFNVQHVEQMKQLTRGYEKGTGRIYVNGMRYTYPIFLDPDGQTYTTIINNDRLVLISVEKFYKLPAVR